jgi:replication factor C subunit 2/4
VEAVNHIREFSRKGNIPNVILAVIFLNKGPPGIGKTSSILCLARHLLKDSF